MAYISETRQIRAAFLWWVLAGVIVVFLMLLATCPADIIHTGRRGLGPDRIISGNVRNQRPMLIGVMVAIGVPLLAVAAYLSARTHRFGDSTLVIDDDVRLGKPIRGVVQITIPDPPRASCRVWLRCTKGVKYVTVLYETEREIRPQEIKKNGETLNLPIAFSLPADGRSTATGATWFLDVVGGWGPPNYRARFDFFVSPGEKSTG